MVRESGYVTQSLLCLLLSVEVYVYGFFVQQLIGKVLFEWTNNSVCIFTF